ncbi:hypothetical protein [Actinoplanes sp. DH11]|uniref:hypothetical protein n=1 Tax=Actinoplanes sp. DH11 TaxID=2857011 RepID=UPI001E2AEE1F|nr:hypothetical protein [Actinoplanes sp. DH11]
MPRLTLDLRHPTGGFLYKLTGPRVLIDGTAQPVGAWGTHAVDVAAGPHRVEVHVPYVLPRKAGRATAEVTVPEQGLALEYMAPTVVFAKGSLGPQGQQKSPGFKAVHAFNIAAVVLVVAYFASRSFS